MAQVTPCPSALMLKKLVDGSATPAEQAALALHLDGCGACQATLDQLSGGRESWNEFARELGRAPAREPALAHALKRLAADPGGTATAAGPVANRQADLKFLDPPDKPGQLGKLAHYEILEEIGRGGMGIVLKAHDSKLQRFVAIKVMAPELAAQASARQRFIREARAAAAVTHDHVVTIHGVEEDHSPPYLVMQYIQGRSLQQRIDDCGALELKEILRIGLQAASGLAAAHAQGLVHRDIKPANILLENGIERVKITDFGLARAIDDARVTQSGVVTGTPQYMSPEQAGGKSVDHRADLFSLGGVMYAMCTGYAPFRASSSMAVLKKVCDESPRPIRDLNPEIPDWLAAIVDKLMAKDPKDRFASATDLANLLGQHLAHMQQPAVFPRPAELNRPKPVPAPAATGSLALPILLMLAPVILVPALLAVTRFLDFRPIWLLLLGTVVIGGGCMLVGAILLMVELARRGNSAWIIVLLLLMLLVACPLPLVAVLGGISFLSLRGGAPPGPGLEAQMTESGMSDRVTNPDALREIGRAVNDFKPGAWIEESDNLPGGTLANGLNWFPEETTFCASFDFQTAPAEIGDALWGLSNWMLGKPGRFGEFTNAVGDGTIMRLSFACVEDPAGKKSRQFIRLSGLWKRDGVINALKKNRGVTQLDLPNSGAEKITLLNFGKDFSLAVVGSHDIVLGAYDRIPEGSKGHEDVVREALDCKSNRLRSLRSGPLEPQLPDVHNNAFCVVVGELPRSLHEPWKNVFGVLPRAVRIVLSEPAPTGPGAMGPAPGLEPGADVKVGLSMAMKNRGDAESVIKNAGGWPRRMRDYLDTALAQLEAKGKAGPEAKSKAAVAKAREQLRLGSLPRTSSAINGFEAYVSLEMPASIWRAMIVLAKTGLPPAEPAGIGTPHESLKRFDPKVDKPITKQSAACTVTEDDGGWKVSKAKTNVGQEFGLHEGIPVRLFEIRRPEIEGCRVTLRALVKSEAVDPAHQACFALQVDDGKKAKPGSHDRAFGPARKGKTNWTPYEISWDCPAGVQPEVLRIDAFLIWEGGIWIKDIEIVTTPLGVSPAPFEPVQKNLATAEPSPSKEVVVKKFNSIADEPITKNVSNRKVTVEEDGWMIESSDNTSYSGDLLIPRVHLFEVRQALTNQEQLTVRFKARSENVKFAFLELVGGYTNASQRIEGSTNWKTYEVTMGHVNNRKVDMLAIDAVIRNGSAAKATIWIKDLEVVKSPLKSAPVVPARELPLKKFDPKVDKPYQTEVGDQRLTLDGDAWRIEAKTAPGVSSRHELRLFELTKQEVRHSTIVLRFKMKTEKVAENVAASVTIRVGADITNWLGRNGNPVRGTTAWKDYEIRCECGDLPAADISILAGISAFDGTMWLKDLELVAIPRK